MFIYLFVYLFSGEWVQATPIPAPTPVLKGRWLVNLLWVERLPVTQICKDDNVATLVWVEWVPVTRNCKDDDRQPYCG